MDYTVVYQNKKRTALEIAQQIQNGWVCAADIAVSMPKGILDAMGQQALEGKLNHIKLHTLLDLMPYKAFSEDAHCGITPISWFSGGGLAKAVNSGRADVMSCYYRDMPELFRQYIDIDAFIVTVSPMDRHGYFSTGTAGSNCEAMLQKSKHVYLEVNENMPRVLNSPMIHISQVDALCENTIALPEFAAAQLDDISKIIGDMIADEVPDGATLQLGIGAIPEAVGLALKSKKNLGIHTELFTDSMVELIECGAVTNQKKPIYKGKTVATVGFGSKRLYEYMNDNPEFMMLPVDIVNDPMVIAQHPNFISVNSALEVDFYGQVCAESVGTKHISGSGGQVDYVRGAVMSKGGKSFIAFPSTAKGGTLSRIKATLTTGAVVTTSKNDVDYIVTEYGMAKLRGKTLSERTKALIAIAHPKFRDELIFEAKKQNIIV